MFHLKRIRTIADYQFGKGVGNILFPDGVKLRMSTTNRVRQIFFNNHRIATLRAKDGLLTLSIEGARRLHEFLKYPEQRVVVNNEAAPFVAEGKNVFAKHVVLVHHEIRAGDEVLVVDEEDNLLATGKSILSAIEMQAFKKGKAVEVRDSKYRT